MKRWLSRLARRWCPVAPEDSHLAQQIPIERIRAESPYHMTEAQYAAALERRSTP